MVQQTLDKNHSSDDQRSGYIEFMLSIEDFGCGIPQDKIDKLFINFENLRQDVEHNPYGRGLGLSICKKLIEEMGGDVKVSSTEGEGSTFSMIFKVMCLMQDQDQRNS